MGRNRTNLVYQYFSYDKEKNMSKCGFCDREVSGQHGSNLLYHLSSHHLEEYHEVTRKNIENKRGVILNDSDGTTTLARVIENCNDTRSPKNIKEEAKDQDDEEYEAPDPLQSSDDDDDEPPKKRERSSIQISLAQDSSSYTPSEKEILMKIMKESAAIVEDKRTDTNSNKRKVAEWQKVQKKLQGLTGKHREVSQIKGLWRRSKRAAKNTYSDHRRAVSETGGDPTSPTGEVKDIMEMCPTDFVEEKNEFDSDSIFMKDHIKTEKLASQADKFDMLGKTVAMKLRDIAAADDKQRLMAEKIINDALFYAEMGQLTLAHCNRMNLEQ